MVARVPRLVALGTAVSALLFSLTGPVARRLMYPAPKGREVPRVTGGELLAIPGRSGRTVHILHVPPPSGAPLLVHFHGNGEALADQAVLAAWFREEGVGFAAVEYPGYGLSGDATPSEQSLYDDADSALSFLARSLGPGHRIVLEGQSLGTGVATEMARRGHGSRLVLVSPFTSMVAMARILIPWLPAHLVVQDRYDSVDKASGLKLPALVVHGTRDELIPFAMGEEIARCLPNARLRPVEGGHHNDLWSVAPSLVHEIAEFARREP